jgi:hypothetical protein
MQLASRLARMKMEHLALDLDALCEQISKRKRGYNSVAQLYYFGFFEIASRQ